MWEIGISKNKGPAEKKNEAKFMRTPDYIVKMKSGFTVNRPPERSFVIQFFPGSAAAEALVATSTPLLDN